MDNILRSDLFRKIVVKLNTSLKQMFTQSAEGGGSASDAFRHKSILSADEHR